MKTLRMVTTSVAFLFLYAASRTSGPVQAAVTGSPESGHRLGLTARVVLVDGTSRAIRLAGVGCSEEMCSRVFIRTRSESGEPVRAWIDSVASISRITSYKALFVYRDGTERNLTFVPGWRVLYVSPDKSSIERVDLANVRSLEFLN